MKKGLPRREARCVLDRRGEARCTVVRRSRCQSQGPDLHLLDGDGGTVDVGAAPPAADGLRGLSERLSATASRSARRSTR
jgi:hypothetical protein